VDAYGREFIKDLTINVTNVTETTSLVRSGTGGADELVGENGHDQIFGFGGDDRLFGLLGNDTLYGGDGNDVVVGGNGSQPSCDDKLYGGDGRDIFAFDLKPSRANIDEKLDFKPADDKIHLSKKIFSKIAKKGSLSSKAFVVGSKVKDKHDRIIYLKKDGALFYDRDGTGKAKAVQFASIGENLKLTYKDFFII
jgi:Ca2+-binding RTX toxin-like protein